VTLDWGPLLLSLLVAGAATVVAGAVGLALAALLATRRRFVGRELVDALVTAPLVVPPTVLGYYVLTLVGVQSALGRAIEALFGAPIVFTRAGAVLAASIGAAPLVVKTARAALEAVDPTLVDVARTLGAGPARAFFTVRVPLARRGLVAALALAFARSLGDFGLTLMVAGDIPGRTRTASLAIYDALAAGREAEATGLVAVLTAVGIAALYGVNRLTRRTVG
jgi:molybdate transport system permease protein